MSTAIILSIVTISIGSIFGIVVSVIGYMFKSRLERIEGDIEKLKTEMKEFRTNYLDRFEKVNTNINESKLEIMGQIGKLYVKIEQYGKN